MKNIDYIINMGIVFGLYYLNKDVSLDLNKLIFFTLAMIMYEIIELKYKK